MASLRDIRKHIKSVKSIKQITYAMKMVAVARIKRAQGAMLASRPFAQKMEQLIADMYCQLESPDFKASSAYGLFADRPKAKVKGLVLITSDKGLCGSFNANILKAAAVWLRANKNEKMRIVCVGKKGRDFLRRIKGLDLEIVYEMVGVFPKAGYVHATVLSENVLKLFANKDVAGVELIYSEFKSMMSQNAVTLDLLPLQHHILDSECTIGRNLHEFGFEPGRAELLGNLLPRYISAQMYRILLESQAAELAARMNAMESASKNASEIIDDLTLRLNKTRQSMITTEINEIVSGAEALGG